MHFTFICVCNIKIKKTCLIKNCIMNNLLIKCGIDCMILKLKKNSKQCFPLIKTK